MIESIKVSFFHYLDCFTTVHIFVIITRFLIIFSLVERLHQAEYFKFKKYYQNEREKVENLEMKIINFFLSVRYLLTRIYITKEKLNFLLISKKKNYYLIKIMKVSVIQNDTQKRTQTSGNRFAISVTAADILLEHSTYLKNK